jgi:hypothetical protein
MNTGRFCIILIIVIILSVVYYSSKQTEGYTNILATPGNYPASDNKPILNTYKFTGRNTVNRNNYNNIWWHYPIFSLGSYTQITNNLKYRKNPDDGSCITAEFCGPLYKDSKMKSNISNPLPPAPQVTPNSVRVNYFTTNKNLFMGEQSGPELPAFQ